MYWSSAAFWGIHLFLSVLIWSLTLKTQLKRLMESLQSLLHCLLDREWQEPAIAKAALFGRLLVSDSGSYFQPLRLNNALDFKGLVIWKFPYNKNWTEMSKLALKTNTYWYIHTLRRLNKKNMNEGVLFIPFHMQKRLLNKNTFEQTGSSIADELQDVNVSCGWAIK